MSTASVANRSAAMRAQVLRELSVGVSLTSPTLYMLLNGVPTGKFQDIPLAERGLKNVRWGQGGTSFDWRVKKTRSKATVGTGALRTRSVSEKDLFASPSISYYMADQTWGLGEGDIALNRASGDQKILDLKKENLQDGIDAVYSEMALMVWAPNETSQNGGLTLFSHANVAAGSYAGIALNATATNGTDTFYYWRCNGYDYGTKTIAANVVEIVSSLARQMLFSQSAGGQGGVTGPDCGVCSEELWPYLAAYFEAKGITGEKLYNYEILTELHRQAIMVAGLPIFWDENFGGATGYVDGAAAEEIMLLTTDRFELATTQTKAEGLFTVRSTGQTDEAWLSGMMGVVKTGMMAYAFKNPQAFQIAYT